jgi:hypothetical protein
LRTFFCCNVSPISNIYYACFKKKNLYIFSLSCCWCFSQVLWNEHECFELKYVLLLWLWNKECFTRSRGRLNFYWECKGKCARERERIQYIFSLSQFIIIFNVKLMRLNRKTKEFFDFQSLHGKIKTTYSWLMAVMNTYISYPYCNSSQLDV